MSQVKSSLRIYYQFMNMAICKAFWSFLICGKEIYELFRHTISKTCLVIYLMNILEKSEKNDKYYSQHL